MRAAATTRVLTRTPDSVVVEAEIQHFPFIPDTGRKDKNGATTYAVPDGIEVLTYDQTTRQSCFSKVTEFTVDPDKATELVTTASGFSAQVSTNESLVVYNGNTGLLKRVTPAEALGCLVPTVAVLPCVGTAHDFDFGWLVGAYAGDGFVTGNRIGFTKLDGSTREFFAEQLRKLDASFKHEMRQSRNYAAEAGDNKLGNSVKYHCVVGTEVYDWLSCAFYTVPPAAREGRAALYKRLPDFMGWSHGARLGLLCGLLDTDGSVSLNAGVGRRKPQLLVNYSTSSTQLKDDILRLCQTLGIRVSSTVVKAKPGRLQRVDSYVVNLGTPSLRKYAGKLKLRSATKQGLLDAYLATVEFDQRDIVPVPVDIINLLCSPDGPLANDDAARGKWSTIRSKGRKTGTVHCSRMLATKVCELLASVPASALLTGWRALVQDETTRWDTVRTVTPAETIVTYDLGVPATKVFAVNGGLVIMDTINVHVPVSEDAKRDAIEKMMPSKNLIHPGTLDVHLVPRQEFGLGLFLASQRSNKPPAVFATRKDAEAAYQRGEISLKDPIRILDQ